MAFRQDWRTALALGGSAVRSGIDVSWADHATCLNSNNHDSLYHFVQHGSFSACVLGDAHRDSQRIGCRSGCWDGERSRERGGFCRSLLIRLFEQSDGIVFVWIGPHGCARNYRRAACAAGSGGAKGGGNDRFSLTIVIPSAASWREESGFSRSKQHQIPRYASE